MLAFKVKSNKLIFSSVIKTTMTVRLKNMKSEEKSKNKDVDAEDDILDKVGDVNNAISSKQIDFAPTSYKSRD